MIVAPGAATEPFRWAYDRLFQAYGPQHWWPAETDFEIVVGAVLVQNTSWSNVERAIVKLKHADLLVPRRMLELPAADLAELIRPAGYFNVKTKRLRAVCEFLLNNGGIEALAELETSDLRRRLLSVKGIGPETADDILLYVFRRPVFVIDAYARRVFGRLDLIGGTETYESLRAIVEQALGNDEPLFNEYHALLVRLGKEHCRTRPRCSGCPLGDRCPAV